MLFNSYHFLFFFPVVIALYFALASKYRWILLLAASYYFYMAWRVEFAGLLLFSTAIDYWAGLKMGAKTTKGERKPYLWISVIVNLGLLVAFKVLTQFNGYTSSLDAFHWFGQGKISQYLLPIGISFYTFQTLSYTIDIYRGKTQPEKHFGWFALYVSFFPQLVAGPIERASHLLPQLKKAHVFNYQRVTSGLKLMFWGFFKKLVIADNLGVFVDAVYNHPYEHQGLSVVLATVFFTFQIFCDFSGYTDIAIGSARVMGIDLVKNFNRPFFATNFRDFWRRWHISLSTWFRDYVYIPLGGNRGSKSRWYGNLFLTFVIAGLWHGTEWTFLIWGAIHGLYLIIGDLTKKVQQQVSKGIGLSRVPWVEKSLGAITVFGLLAFSLLFFRAKHLNEAMLLIKGIGHWNTHVAVIQDHHFWIPFMGVMIVFLLGVHALERKKDIVSRVSDLPLMGRWSIYLLLGAIFIAFGNFKSEVFIYYQF